jgi:hypothetical protein
VSVLPQKYTLSNGGSTAAPLYIEVQVYNPLTGVGIPGVSVTIYISKNGVPQTPITVTTDANGVATVCGRSGYTVSDQLQIGYPSVSAPGYTSAPGNSNVPVSTSSGVPSFC